MFSLQAEGAAEQPSFIFNQTQRGSGSAESYRLIRQTAARTAFVPGELQSYRNSGFVLRSFKLLRVFLRVQILFHLDTGKKRIQTLNDMVCILFDAESQRQHHFVFQL